VPAVLNRKGKFPRGRARWRSATAALAAAAQQLGDALGRHGCDARDATALARDLTVMFPDATRKDYVRRMRRLRARTGRIDSAIGAAMVTKRPASTRVEARLAKLDELLRADPDATQDEVLDRLRARGFPTLTLRTMQRDRAKLRARAAAD
jgi:hypothetical protein